MVSLLPRVYDPGGKKGSWRQAERKQTHMKVDDWTVLSGKFTTDKQVTGKSRRMLWLFLLPGNSHTKTNILFSIRKIERCLLWASVLHMCSPTLPRRSPTFGGKHDLASTIYVGADDSIRNVCYGVAGVLRGLVSRVRPSTSERQATTPSIHSFCVHFTRSFCGDAASVYSAHQSTSGKSPVLLHDSFVSIRSFT